MPGLRRRPRGRLGYRLLPGQSTTRIQPPRPISDSYTTVPANQRLVHNLPGQSSPRTQPLRPISHSYTTSPNQRPVHNLQAMAYLKPVHNLHTMDEDPYRNGGRGGWINLCQPYARLSTHLGTFHRWAQANAQVQLGRDIWTGSEGSNQLVLWPACRRAGMVRD